MVQCPTCGSEVSEQAAFCPDCGTDLKPAGGAGPAPAGGGKEAAASAPAPDAASAPPAPPELGIEEEPAATPAVVPNPAVAASAAPAPEASPAPAAAPASTPAPTEGAAAGARLILKRSGAPTSEVFPLGGHVVIGRFDPETGPVDVDLGNLPEATYVSRQHAELIPDGGGWKIKDLGSRNGVFVRKQGGGAFQRVTGEESVSSGDEIALGNARFELRVG